MAPRRLPRSRTHLLRETPPTAASRSRGPLPAASSWTAAASPRSLRGSLRWITRPGRTTRWGTSCAPNSSGRTARRLPSVGRGVSIMRSTVSSGRYMAGLPPPLVCRQKFQPTCVAVFAENMIVRARLSLKLNSERHFLIRKAFLKNKHFLTLKRALWTFTSPFTPSAGGLTSTLPPSGTSFGCECTSARLRTSGRGGNLRSRRSSRARWLRSKLATLSTSPFHLSLTLSLTPPPSHPLRISFTAGPGTASARGTASAAVPGHAKGPLHYPSTVGYYFCVWRRGTTVPLYRGTSLIRNRRPH